MRVFRFFVTKTFLKKPIIVICTLLLLLLSNYIIFIAARSTISTFQGYEEIKQLNQDGNYIANLDPNGNMNMDAIGKSNTQSVYDYLNDNLSYALFTDGFVVSLPNAHDMEVTVAYLNEEYYELNKQFEVSQGKGLEFDYSFTGDDTEIPVLVGKGLSETYPVGCRIIVEEPALQKQVTLKVQGILKPNMYHSNFYWLSSKQYYNFSVIVPVNKEFINNSDVGFQLQGLYDIILLQTSEDKMEDLHDLIQNNLGFEFNFYSREENIDYYNEIFFSSLKIISALTAILTVILTCLYIWGALTSIRLMVKDFTINLFVGLSYSRLRRIFYGYYGIMSLFNLIVLFAITASLRYGSWIRKDAAFSTFGLLGVIGIDWLALLAVLIFNAVIGILIVEIMMWRIKKIPISLGVIQ